MSKKLDYQLNDEDRSMTSMEVYVRLLKYLKDLKLPFVISIIGFAIFAASQPALAKLMEMIISAIEAKDADARWTLPLLAVGVFVVRGFGHFLGTYYNGYVGAKFLKTLKTETFEHISQLPAEFFDQNLQGKILHRINSGVNKVTGAVTDAFKTIIREGLTIIFLLAYVFYLNWQLSLTFLAITPIVAGLVAYTTRRLKKISRKTEASMGVAMQVTKEMVSNFNLVRGFGGEQYERGRYGAAVGDVFEKQLKIRKLEAITTPILQWVVAMAVAAIVFMILTPANLETQTTGELISYLTAVALIPKSLRQLSSVNITIQKGIVGAEMVFYILDIPIEEDTGTIEKYTVKGELSIRELNFKYSTSNNRVLKDFNLEITAGEMIALVGKSGSGKSTLTHLITRMYNVDDGEILLDGDNITDYTLANLRKHISIVSQNVTLFDDTIRNNIAYGEVQYSDEQIIDAAKKAHAWEFIAEQSKQLDTAIGDNGLKLSGGQRQRIAIARAFLKDAPIRSTPLWKIVRQ